MFRLTWSLACLLLVANTEGASAAPSTVFAFEELKDKSSEILIVRCLRIERVENTTFFPNNLGRFLATAKVASVLKGRQMDTVTIELFLPIKGSSTISNGPSSFYLGDEVVRKAQVLNKSESASIDEGIEYILVYLIRDANNVFVPASGQQHAGFSSLILGGLRIVNHIEMSLDGTKKPHENSFGRGKPVIGPRQNPPSEDD